MRAAIIGLALASGLAKSTFVMVAVAMVAAATGAVATGAVATGAVAKSELATGELATGELAAGKLAADELPTGKVATAGNAREAPVVVELFTSQGCSSCPPADAFLTDLGRQRREVLPLAFHVTYWDYLGWKDPYSLDAATARQRAYAQKLGDDGVYTPQMVVDGTTGFVGSNRSRGLGVIASAPPKTVQVSVVRDGATLVVRVGAGAGRAQIQLIGFDRRHETPVGRGENSGRMLVETNVVRSLTPIGPWSGPAVELRLSPPAGEVFAVLVQADDGRILGAARLSS
jgi:hypothetical protein